jgi:hypothetical protein
MSQTVTVVCRNTSAYVSFATGLQVVAARTRATVSSEESRPFRQRVKVTVAGPSEDVSTVLRWIRDNYKVV